MYQRARIMSSSLPPRRKAYDYLIQQGGSGQKPLMSAHNPNFGSKSIRQQLPYQTPIAFIHPSPAAKQQTQYELIVEFQLRRQKQKTLILEERLKNKQSFIKQMKQFQDELTLAFEKCQQQLQFYKQQCITYESKFNSFNTFNNTQQQPSPTTPQNVKQFVVSAGDKNISFAAGQQEQQKQLIRQYVQQIAELKHLVIRLQEQINYHEKKQRLYKKNGGGNNLLYLSSAQKQFYPGGGKHDTTQRGKQSRRGLKTLNQQNQPQRLNKQSVEEYPPTKKQKNQSKHTNNLSKQRSKTLANQFVQQKNTQNFNILAKIQQCILNETHKISGFIYHFLTMCQFFCPQLQQQESIKHKLKKSWKWIKNALVEWNYLKKSAIQKVKAYKIGNIVLKSLPLGNLDDDQIIKILDRLLNNKMMIQHC